MIRGETPSAVSKPPSPTVTATRSFGADTMLNTTSRSAKSTGRSTTWRPATASGSAFDRVRLYTLTSWPASSRRVASAAPIRPIPIQPILTVSDIDYSSFLASYACNWSATDSPSREPSTAERECDSASPSVAARQATNPSGRTSTAPVGVIP